MSICIYIYPLTSPTSPRPLFLRFHVSCSPVSKQVYLFRRGRLVRAPPCDPRAIYIYAYIYIHMYSYIERYR